MRTAIESYASLPGAAITSPLVAAYESPAALAETYVGYSGQPDLRAEGSYVRIDGPAHLDGAGRAARGRR